MRRYLLTAAAAVPAVMFVYKNSSGVGGGVFRSFDGLTWTKIPVHATFYPMAVARCPITKNWVLTARNASGQVVVFYSADGGTTWTQGVTLAASSGLAYGLNATGDTTHPLVVWIFSGSDATCYYSTNGGVTWPAAGGTTSPFGSEMGLQHYAWLAGSSRHIITGHTPTAGADRWAYSSSANSLSAWSTASPWTEGQAVSGLGNHGSGRALSSGKAADGVSTFILTSADGATWTSTGQAGLINDFAYSPTLGRSVAMYQTAIGSNTSAWSDDGLSFSVATTAPVCIAVEWLASVAKFVALTDLLIPATSSDGITWTSGSAGVTTETIDNLSLAPQCLAAA